jgi:hypothetical protein
LSTNEVDKSSFCHLVAHACVVSYLQYTSEFLDLHSRGNMLRGGSNYRPGVNGTKGSHWYFPAVTTVARVQACVNSNRMRAACFPFRHIKPSKSAQRKHISFYRTAVL